MALFAVPQLTALDGNGDPIPGARVCFHETGVNTPKTAYTDSHLTAPAPHPAVAVAAGRFAPIYLTGEAHKMVLTDAAGVTITTMDPVYGVTGPVSAAAATLLDDARRPRRRSPRGPGRGCWTIRSRAFWPRPPRGAGSPAGARSRSAR